MRPTTELAQQFDALEARLTALLAAKKALHDHVRALSQENDALRIERTAAGELLLMPPTGGITGSRNVRVSVSVEIWNAQAGLGITFDSSTGFLLPSGAMRSPDAAWVALPRWQSLTSVQRAHFPPLCPDFVVEIRSRGDNLKKLQTKMDEWLANGCQLAWLLDPDHDRAYVYRPGLPTETVVSFDLTLAGEPVLPGFVFFLNTIR